MMNSKLFLTILFIFCVFGVAVSSPIILANFNIQVFGVKKMENLQVVEVLVQTLKNFDIISIQEIRDSTDTAIYQLLEELNKGDSSAPYRVVVSARLGRSNSKEQYAFIYHSRRVKILDTYHYPDSADKFERPPFSAVVVPTNGNLEKGFFITNIHTSPSDAVEEIGALTDVQEYFMRASHVKSDYLPLVEDRWIVLGDYNADCTYFPRSQRNNTRIYSDRHAYHWVIPDGFDTTVTQHGCAYDRIVVSKNLVSRDVLYGTGKVFNFREKFRMSEEGAKRVSDHFPVYVGIKQWDQLESNNGNEALIL